MKPLVLTPGFGDNAPTATLYYGQDVRESLRLLPEASVHTVCTSPPYWGLRDYGTGDRQIGLEESPQEFVDALVEVFREVKRVLRPDGTLWLNLGDSYAGGGRAGKNPEYHANHKMFGKKTNPKDVGKFGVPKAIPQGLKAKDLVGIPWRVAFALQADGWWLRNDIIWSKPNPMPESAKDRCTKAHEYIFLLTKSAKYFYDAAAIAEPSVTGERFHGGYAAVMADGSVNDRNGRNSPDNKAVTRNKRSVWTINSQSYAGSHFAVFPEKIPRLCLAAGCPPGGTVLDPFSGSATTGMVALQEGHNYIGIDINSEYLDLAQARIEGRAAPQKPDATGGPTSDIFNLFGG